MVAHCFAREANILSIGLQLTAKLHPFPDMPRYQINYPPRFAVISVFQLLETQTSFIISMATGTWNRRS
jgi:hypothetical protein